MQGMPENETHVTGIPVDFEGRSFTILKRGSVHEPLGTTANVTFGILVVVSGGVGGIPNVTLAVVPKGS
jgi:hypothetical protein